MRLSRETRQLAKDIVTHTKHFCERMDDSSKIDRTTKAQCQEIVDRLPNDIKSCMTSKAIYPVSFLTSMLLTMIETFKKDAMQEIYSPVIKRLAFLPTVKRFQANVIGICTNFDDLYDTLTQYKREKP